MHLALAGNSGFVNERDGHGMAIAYSPLSTLGLGMVLSADSAAFHPELQQASHYVAPLILLLLLAGGLLLRWQVLPVIRKLQV